jgi:hypothetical protein
MYKGGYNSGHVALIVIPKIPETPGHYMNQGGFKGAGNWY